MRSKVAARPGTDPPLPNRLRWGASHGLLIGVLYAALVLFTYLMKGTGNLGHGGLPIGTALALYIASGSVGGAIVGALLPFRRQPGGRALIGVAVMLPVSAAFGTLLFGAPFVWGGAEWFGVLSSALLLGGIGGATTR